MASTHNRVDPQTLLIELKNEQGVIVKDDLKHLVIELNEQGSKDDLKFFWPWFMNVETYGWHGLAGRSGCNDLVHSWYLKI